MAHFAQLNENNISTQVIVVNDSDSGGGSLATENIGIAFCRSIFGQNTNWKQTSYNSNFRKNYCGIGFTFDPTKGTDGAFIAPKPFPSWLLNETTCLWEAPMPYPNDGNRYRWDETTVNWVLVA